MKSLIGESHNMYIHISIMDIPHHEVKMQSGMTVWDSDPLYLSIAKVIQRLVSGESLLSSKLVS